jgi:hypothetical protein
MTPYRKDSKMKSHWLKCNVSCGQFSSEFVVQAQSFNGKGFSLFVPEELVEFEKEPTENGHVEGWLQVDIITEDNGLALIQLPRAPLENGSTVTVNASEVSFREAREPA